MHFAIVYTHDFVLLLDLEQQSEREQTEYAKMLLQIVVHVSHFFACHGFISRA